jgi:hypothetical protein
MKQESIKALSKTLSKTLSKIVKTGDKTCRHMSAVVMNVSDRRPIRQIPTDLSFRTPTKISAKFASSLWGKSTVFYSLFWRLIHRLCSWAVIPQKSEVKPFSELTSLLINRNFSDVRKVLLKLIQQLSGR